MFPGDDEMVPGRRAGQTSRMADADTNHGPDAAGTAIATRLHELVCCCGEPACRVHLVGEGVSKSRPWQRGDPGCDTAPCGHGTFAIPACERHTYFGVSVRVGWLAGHWTPWVTHMDFGGFHGARAVLELMTAEDDARHDADGWTPRGHRG